MTWAIDVPEFSKGRSRGFRSGCFCHQVAIGGGNSAQAIVIGPATAGRVNDVDCIVANQRSWNLHSL